MYCDVFHFFNICVFFSLSPIELFQIKNLLPKIVYYYVKYYVNSEQIIP